MLLLICALLPVVLGGALPLLKIEKRSLRMAYVFLTTLATSVLAAFLILRPENAHIEVFRITDAFVCALHLDGAGKVYLGIAALLWPLAVLYAMEYMCHEKHEGNFFAWYTVTYGAAVLLAAAKNLFTLYIFFNFRNYFLIISNIFIHYKENINNYFILFYICL